jgi:hypothetical protein
MAASGGDGNEGHAEHAVEELEKAVLVPSGGFVTVERTWMVDEDPDLEPLRGHFLFRNFVCTAFPGPEVSDMPSPGNWLEEQMRDYDYRLLEGAAKVMQRAWNLRSEESVVDIRIAIDWLRSEHEVWRCVHDVADEERLSRWIDRVELVRSVQAHCYYAASSTPEFPPRVIPGEFVSDGRPRTNARLEVLKDDLEDEEEWERTLYLIIQKGQDVLREAAADGVAHLKGRTVRKLCSGYSAAWQTLGEWLARDRGEKPFRDALENVPQPTRRRRLAISDPRKVLI